MSMAHGIGLTERVLEVNVRSNPVNAEQRAGLAEDSDNLLDLTMAYSLADAAKYYQCPGLE